MCTWLQRLGLPRGCERLGLGLGWVEGGGCSGQGHACVGISQEEARILEIIHLEWGAHARTIQLG